MNRRRIDNSIHNKLFSKRVCRNTSGANLHSEQTLPEDTEPTPVDNLASAMRNYPHLTLREGCGMALSRMCQYLSSRSTTAGCTRIYSRARLVFEHQLDWFGTTSLLYDYKSPGKDFDKSYLLHSSQCLHQFNDLGSCYLNTQIHDSF